MAKIRKYAILLSVFLHIMIIIILGLNKINFIQLQQNKEISEPTEQLVFELVETPENIKQQKPESESDFVSDKDTRAADLTENRLPAELPFQSGQTGIPLISESEARTSEQDETKINEPAEILSELKQNKKTFLETFEAQQQLQNLSRQDADYENLLSQVKNQGGMSLNTYKWEFAPYLLEMKRKVQAHNNPPFAFTHLGAIDGDILLRFKVLQDGSVQDLEILSSTAHYSLEDTSTRAIQFSSPFKPLPDNFPKEYLEITALFSYILRK